VVVAYKGAVAKAVGVAVIETGAATAAVVVVAGVLKDKGAVGEATRAAKVAVARGRPAPHPRLTPSRLPTTERPPGEA